jgi:hypothetical protein
VRVVLAIDLHEPDALETQVRCALLDPAAEDVLGLGFSGLVRFERLYCHGCRDRWGGHGTSLSAPHVVAGDGLGVSGALFFCSPSSSPGYTKN